MNPFASSFSTDPPYRTEGSCPKCGRALGVADIHTKAVGPARRAWYICPNAKCSFEWSQAWTSVDKGEHISADEILDVHESLRDFEGRLTDLLEVKPT